MLVPCDTIQPSGHEMTDNNFLHMKTVTVAWDKQHGMEWTGWVLLITLPSTHYHHGMRREACVKGCWLALPNRLQAHMHNPSMPSPTH